MSSGRRILVLIFVGLFSILTVKGVAWFFENYEYKEVEDTSSYSKQARRNKFLAAEYYLRELGLDVESNSARAQLLAPHTKNETILLNDYGPKLSPTRYAELKKWLASGGHLIMAANNYHYESTSHNDKHADDVEADGTQSAEDDSYNDETDNNQLLEDYGIHAHYTEFDEATRYPDAEETPIYLFAEGFGIGINFHQDYNLIDTNSLASFTLQDESGIHLLQIKIGKGLLTVLSDNYFLSNYSIGRHDHAYLLWLLSAKNLSPDSKAWLLFNSESDSIFTLLWRHAKQACIAFMIFVVVGLWAMQNRLGPVIPDINYKTRNVIEHLRAIARFSWRQDRGMRLFHHSRLACEQTLISRYPVLKGMSIQERTEHIAEILDISPARIQKTLYHEPKSTNEFINSSHQLQKLWVLQ